MSEPGTIAEEYGTIIDDSPLREMDPSSIDELLLRINEDLIANTPENIANDDERLKKIVAFYREQAVAWAVKEAQEKAPRAKRKPSVPIIEIDL